MHDHLATLRALARTVFRGSAVHYALLRGMTANDEGVGG